MYGMSAFGLGKQLGIPRGEFVTVLYPGADAPLMTAVDGGAPATAATHYDLVARAIRYLRAHRVDQPGLEELAAALHTSESHLQRVFSAWAGVSPKRFLQALTRDAAVDALRRRATVLEASLDAGLSGPARLHDLTVACDAMTPGEIASGGAGISLSHGWAETPFGAALIGFGDRGICHLAFHDRPDVDAVADYRADWPGAAHTREDDAAEHLAARIFHQPLERGRLHLLLRGTNFQLKVWQALLEVGAGERVTYGTLAELAGSPGASRAVGSAMARNRIAYLIPCHRVIRGDGSAGDYRWGAERKLAMLGRESVGVVSA